MCKESFSDKFYQKNLEEHTIQFLRDKSDQGRKARGLRITGSVQQVKRGENNTLLVRFMYRGSKNRRHTQVVQFDNPNFDFFKKDLSIPELKEGLLGSEVRVYCGCPDFLLYGQKFNLGPSGKYKDSTLPLAFGAKPRGIKEPKVVVQPANVNDPQRKHVLCKHLIHIANNIQAVGTYTAAIHRQIKAGNL